MPEMRAVEPDLRIIASLEPSSRSSAFWIDVEVGADQLTP